MLTETQKQQYQQDGYLVLPNFKSAAEIAALRKRAEAIVDAFEPNEAKTIFTTQEQARHIDDYFMGSADKIRCFLEEEAFDAQGQLTQAKALSINKIGHALHDMNPVFERFSHGALLVELAGWLGVGWLGVRPCLLPPKPSSPLKSLA